MGWIAVLTLVLGTTGALATPPQPASAAEVPVSAPRTETSSAPPPDDEFIEFLGTDDVGDAAWWEFLKKAGPRNDESSRAPPSQDAKQ